MKKILITISEGQFSKRQILSLESLIRQNYKTHISADPLLVIWNQVPAGNIFHDYKNGQPSILVIESNENIEQHQRVEMFEACTRDWLQITGQRIDQLIISVLDTPVFNKLLQRNSKHLTIPGKVKYFLRLGTDLLSSRTFKGYYTFNSSF
ncbi:hypothetical protein QQ008_07890 [Fulvivirgaceae bacterium BMA10]|uniref:Uncharacterized protein n=1 Tax=Splendidivirga corallicola TaxID=3051826 RepID=A0ABT8KKN6_9BACT|nr:hypothetical protein [Fulvivirgaceae bacterium BMA10]